MTEIMAELARRAAQNGRSVEDERREILRRHLHGRRLAKRSFMEVLAEMPCVQHDDLFDVR